MFHALTGHQKFLYDLVFVVRNGFEFLLCGIVMGLASKLCGERSVIGIQVEVALGIQQH